MRSVGFAWLDVFTSTPFGGNPLVVVDGADAMRDEEMQRIAAEFHVSETVFILAPATQEATRRLRIFTPSIELPYAGHPTIGAAVFLAQQHVVDLTTGPADLVLEEAAGPVHVRVAASGEGGLTATLTAPQPPVVGAAPDAADVARLVGLDVADLVSEPAVVSVGVPFLLIPVRSTDALLRARLDVTTWDGLVAGRPGEHLYVYTPPVDGEITARMFAPAMGIAEDPATGAAATALGARLGALQAADGLVAWTISQGTAIGRPSQLHVEAQVDGGAVTRVRVGGAAVRVAEGVLRLQL